MDSSFFLLENVESKMKFFDYLPSRNIFDSPEVEGAHRYHQDIAKRFVIIKYAKEHIKN